MNKKWLFLIMAVFVLSGCVVERLNNVISNGSGGVPDLSWDLDFEVPIGKVKAQLSKIEEVNKMLESLKFTDNASVENGESALIHVTIDDMTIDGSTFNVDPSVNEALGLEVGDNVLTWPLPIGRLCVQAFEGDLYHNKVFADIIILLSLKDKNIIHY